MTYPPEPPANCPRCPRLVQFRADNAAAHPDWFNGAVPSVGAQSAQLLIVGLAPGLQGANRTGRPFTGDYAGDLLYATLTAFGFAAGQYDRRADDGLTLRDCMITNAVRCVPPANKPTGEESRNCQPYLHARIDALPRLRVLMSLGRVAHDSVVRTFGLKMRDFTFAHGARHQLTDRLCLFDSYHCSRYNTNTGRLTEEMFHSVFAGIRTEIDGPAGS